MTFDEISSRLYEIRGKNSKLNSVVKKAETGLVDFTDADEFAKELGESMLDFLSESVIDLSEVDNEFIDALKKITKGDATKTREFCELIQNDLNKLSDLGLNAYVPDFDDERLDSLFEYERVREMTARKLGLDMQNFILYCVDQFVKSNAEFQDRIGLDPVIVRKWDGITGTHDTRHTDYCSRLAGVFKYGEEPRDVYKRHVGCGCTVTYYPSGEKRGRITALSKGEKDINEVLWNTGKYYGRSKQAIRSQRKKTLERLMLEKW